MQARFRLRAVAALLAAQVLLCFIARAQDEPPLPPGLAPPKDAETESRSGEEPDLPPGLEPQEPSLPAGLADEPALPVGLSAKSKLDEVEAQEERFRLPFTLTGFCEARGGARTQQDKYERGASIGETRLQLEAQKAWERATFNITADFLYDAVDRHHSVRWESGRGFLDLRQANVVVTPVDAVDLKIGRQVLTWGTGDMLFINDLFPKDWQSFFIGRDPEYLKAPSDAAKAGVYTDIVNLDVVWIPRFDADRHINGERISYWSDALGRRAGRDAVIRTEQPNDWINDYELAWRVYRNVKGYELAAYGYRGYWKSPAGMNPVTGKATFPQLSAYGASARGNVLKGIGSAEVGYYDSRDDRSGRSPFVRNSEMRYLVGYEQEVARDLTAGVQYYLEHMMHHDNYLKSLPPGTRPKDQYRHVLTLRLTKLLMNQNLDLSLFTYFCPSDHDAYIRPRAHYKIDDHWSVEVGGNVFLGSDEYTFFGQFENNTNVYAAVRFSF